MNEQRTRKWKRAAALLLVLTLLSALAGTAFAEGEVLNDGNPWVDYVLRENVETVEARPESPKDDLYLYANYDWAKNTEIRPGYTSESSFGDVDDEIREMCMAVLTDDSLQSEDAAMVQGLYKACLDWDTRNALGVEPVRKTMDRILAVSSLDELTALFCDRDEEVGQLFGFGTDTGLNDPETYLLAINSMGLLLGDSAEYVNRTEMGKRFEEASRIVAAKMLPKFGYCAGDGACRRDHELRRAHVTRLCPAHQQ